VPQRRSQPSAAVAPAPAATSRLGDRLDAKLEAQTRRLQPLVERGGRVLRARRGVGLRAEALLECVEARVQRRHVAPAAAARGDALDLLRLLEREEGDLARLNAALHIVLLPRVVVGVLQT